MIEITRSHRCNLPKHDCLYIWRDPMCRFESSYPIHLEACKTPDATLPPWPTAWHPHVSVTSQVLALTEGLGRHVEKDICSLQLFMGVCSSTAFSRFWTSTMGRWLRIGWVLCCGKNQLLMLESLWGQFCELQLFGLNRLEDIRRLVSFGSHECDFKDLHVFASQFGRMICTDCIYYSRKICDMSKKSGYMYLMYIVYVLIALTTVVRYVTCPRSLDICI